MVMMIPRPPVAPPLPPPPPPLPMKNPVKRKSPSVKSTKSSTTSQGFRLMEDQGDTGSVYSIYKQKIDAMFESESENTNNNAVQAQIEKMFTDVAQDGAGNCHSFSVDYLGSVPLREKVTSLTGLQTPLADLYFEYKKHQSAKINKVLTGRLEISSQGLKVHYQGDKTDLEQLNSFPTIAVWSAVKFVIHQKKYAFLPLITDPDNIDKRTLFRALNPKQESCVSCEATTTHSPLFAVVMRKVGINNKQLECHGFVCQTSEDAIVIAATLYKSLMAHMKLRENNNRKKPKSRNGITCMSIASSVATYQDKITPIRPPRKKRSTASSTISENDNISETRPLLDDVAKPKKSVKTRRAPKVPDDIDAILRDEPEDDNRVIEIKPKTFSDQINTCMSREQRQITAEIKRKMSESTNRGLKHVTPDEKVTKNAHNNNNENSGDILTKVTIPRSGSFLNAGGLTRYKSKVSRGNGQVTGGSPLGFNELFNEFRLQEGLHSLDDILGVIIDPDGMSFNDLKPIYKEFLLKLSVTLTKDELYQRSKLIMRKQKRKLIRRTTVPPSGISVRGKFKRLKHIFQKNLKSKMNRNKNESTKIETTNPKLLTESSISTSSYDTRQFTPRAEPLKKPSYRKKNETSLLMSKRDRLSTSEESDFFSMRRKNKINSINNNNNQQNNRNSSSGYVSCSECSYDSDTCTCISADKCYCSLGGNHNNNNNNKSRRGKQQCDCQNDFVFCDCDTDSCTESNKCYCQLMVNKNDTILEQLKRRGLIPQPPSTNQQKHKKLCKKSSNTKSTRSLEYVPNPAEAIYYQKLANRRNSVDNHFGRLDYDLFVDRNVRKPTRYSSALSERTGGRTTAISSGEALSVKKSAEIAALFADIKLSQTTDIAHLASSHSNASYYHHQRTVQNALYNFRNNSNFINGNHNNNNNMYSARNGLYTIQSQSDESHRSSPSDDQKRPKNNRMFNNNNHQEREYFELEPQFGAKNRNSTTLENSLGYLP